MESRFMTVVEAFVNELPGRVVYN